MDLEGDHRQANTTPTLNKRHSAEDDSIEPKRRRYDFATSNGTPNRTADDYTVGWVCALPIEMAAAKCMLQTVHDNLDNSPDDSNTYSLGSLHGHNIAIACLPTAGYGTNNAAIVASNMRRTFPSIRMFLLVGIGGGAPSDEHDVRLGDVVVSTTVIQYDMGKTVQQGLFRHTGIERRPVPTLMTAVSALRAQHELKPPKVPIILSEIQERYPNMRQYTDREQLQDLLFNSDYDHAEVNTSCSNCDSAKLKSRSARSDENPVIHYGVIASGNQVMKHAQTRDRVAQQFKAICFEMEAAGLMESFPCLVIRGICDYSDSHKSKGWQKYASATAAAYANELLSIIPATEPQTIPTSAYISSLERLSRAGISTGESVQTNRQLVMDSLSFDKIEARQSNIKSAHGKTCAWLLSHPDYIGWLSLAEYAEHHGLLWIHGKPGAGKSTIMKYIYTRAQENTKNTISFFFNARGDVLEKSTEGMYRSLLVQLFQKLPDLQEVLDSYDYNCLDHNDGSPWQIDILQRLFSAAIAKLGRRRVMCFIDALDECSESQIRDMVDHFEQLGQSSLDSKREFHICFSSRHYPTICVQYGRTLTLEDQPGHSMDLDKYVRNKLRAGKGKDVEPIRNELLRKSAGVFMWVVLVVNILNEEFQRGRIFAVRKRLQETPAELSALFKDILQRDNKNMDDLLLCIQWILYAKLPLKPEEFYYAMVAGLDPEPQELSEWDTQLITLDDMKRFVSSSSKGLAEVTKSKAGTVQFIHESVRDFLLKDGGIHELWPNLDEDFQNISHDKLKECCYVYMKTDISEYVSFDVQLPKATSDEAKVLRQRLSEKFPLLRYATHNVLYHANTAATKLPQDAFLKTFDLKSWINLDNTFENFEIRRHTSSASLLYILAENNFANLIRSVFLYDTRISFYGERYGSPLFAAIVNGNGGAVGALLQLEDTALIESALKEFPSGRDFKLRRNETSLHWAVRAGYTGTVQLLFLDPDINLDSRYQKGFGDITELLHLACSNGKNGSTAIVRLLLDRGADINLKKKNNEYDESPLSLAIKNGYTEIAELLLTRGATTQYTGPNDETLLHTAARYGYTEIVQLLLDRGLDVESRDRQNRTPLFIASMNGNTQVVQLLLDQGADFSTRDDSGRTPLHFASKQNNVEVTRLLLNQGANIDSKDETGMAPLIFAIENDYQQNVRLLLDRGANVNSADEQGNSPLHYAFKTERIEIAEQLLDWGANMESKDQFGHAPLLRAVDRESTRAIQLLLDRGAHIETKDRVGWTPLIRAIMIGKEPMIQLLLERGADVNATDYGGNTALSYVNCWNKEVAQLFQNVT